MPIVYAAVAFLAFMVHDINADKPRKVIAEIDGREKVVTVRRYHKPVVRKPQTNDLGEGFYINTWGELDVRPNLDE